MPPSQTMGGAGSHRRKPGFVCCACVLEAAALPPGACSSARKSSSVLSSASVLLNCCRRVGPVALSPPLRVCSRPRWLSDDAQTVRWCLRNIFLLYTTSQPGELSLQPIAIARLIAL